MNTENSHDKKCPRCATPLPVDAPEGLCPRCLGALPFDTETVFAGADGKVGMAPSLTPEELAPHFPHLEILECLGRGGMGVVYKARQKSLNRFVALKLLAPERADDAAFARRFEIEARALAALNHPNIVTIHDFGKAGGFFFLLMEFVDGVNLRRAMRADRFTPEQALAIVPPVCDALQYAHDHGVVHRDIKPENLLLDKDGRVKVADFGIAKMLHADGADTVAGLAETQPAGTPQYSAPEQRTANRTDHRADIYSLGVVLYELLTGELPGAKLEAPSRKVQIDVRLDAIVLRALEKSPELRYANVTEMKTQVEGVVREPESPRETARGLIPALVESWEYKSQRTLFGLPLLHVTAGNDPVSGKSRVAHGVFAFGTSAKGIFAFGGRAKGVFAFGGLAVGFFAVGGVSVGVISCGGLGLALFFAYGGLALAPVAIGGLAMGIYAIGGIAIGEFGFGGKIVATHAMSAKDMPGVLQWMLRLNAFIGIPFWVMAAAVISVFRWAKRKATANPTPEREVDITQSEADALHADPVNWKWSWLYRCSRDPRLIVPKRKAVFGWTANFAHGATWWVLLAMVSPAIGMARLVNDPSLRGWAAGLISALYLLCVAWCCGQLSKVKSNRCMSPLVPALLALGIIAGAMGVQRLYQNWRESAPRNDVRRIGSLLNSFAPPKLLALAWGDESTVLKDKKTRQPIAWHADGSPVVSDSEIGLINGVGLVHDAVLGKQPCLRLWFMEDSINKGSFSRLTLLDTKGASIAEPGETVSTTMNGAIAYAANLRSTPDKITVRLAYGTGAWQDGREIIPGNFGDGKLSARVSLVESKSSDTSPGVSIGIVQHDLESPDTQYDFVAITRDGRRVSHSSAVGGSDLEQGVVKQSFIFENLKSSDVRAFLLRTRPIRTVEFNDVLLKTDDVTDVVSLAAMNAWLNRIDSGDYASSWDDASELFRNAVTNETWSASLEKFRRPFGKMVSRIVISKTEMARDGGVASSQLVVQFKTTFDGGKSAVETVTFVLEKDGRWKVAGYFIKPAVE